MSIDRLNPATGKPLQPDERIYVDSVGGWAPVQGGGYIAGEPLYFRARGSGWALHVGEPSFWSEYGEYGEDRFDASYMPTEDALALISEAGRRYLEHRADAPVTVAEREMMRFLHRETLPGIGEVALGYIHKEGVGATYSFLTSIKRLGAIVQYEKAIADDRVAEEVWKVEMPSGERQEAERLKAALMETLIIRGQLADIATMTRIEFVPHWPRHAFDF